MLFLASFLLAGAALLPLAQRWSQALLGGFDVGVLVFSLSLWPLTRDHTPGEMRRHARDNDARRLGVLVITSLLMAVMVTGVAIELPDARRESGAGHMLSMLLVLASLVVAWVFSNLICALHYAHLFYGEGIEGGLKFPADARRGRLLPQLLGFRLFFPDDGHGLRHQRCGHHRAAHPPLCHAAWRRGLLLQSDRAGFYDQCDRKRLGAIWRRLANIALATQGPRCNAANPRLGLALRKFPARRAAALCALQRRWVPWTFPRFRLARIRLTTLTSSSKCPPAASR
jgi:hypothetical protein